MNRLIIIFLFLFWIDSSYSQVFVRDFQFTTEKARRDFLLDQDVFLKGLRPKSSIGREHVTAIRLTSASKIEIQALPLYLISRYASDRPYGWSDFGLVPGVGGQQYASTGLDVKWKFLKVSIQPEFVFSQNTPFDGFGEGVPQGAILDRYFLWNFGDYPERFGDGAATRFWWGQSSFTASYGAFEAGISTGNVWWGPGQFNSLSFSNNSEGFPKLSINTTKPAKTFLGDIETALIFGMLRSSNLEAAQNQELNNRYFQSLPTDWRYLNALMFDYSPKWVDGLHLGFVRTFQVYNNRRGNTLYDWLPVVEGFQKKNFFQNGNTVDFDANGRSQQLILFGKYAFKKAKGEIYFELGRRDHAFNWREYILNPEHARAYLFGFLKLVSLPKANRYLQLRGEITHQQESINRIVRYENLGGFLSWQMHGQARGFTNRGQGLGVGIGQGANVQTLEVAVVEGWNKMGIQLERLENDQGFYYRSFYLPSEYKPWIDYSVGFLYDKQFGSLLLSSKLQVIHARNYQWQLDPLSTPEFPRGRNLTSVLGQVSAVYFW
ncbi:capsule assembly Wzi family protein [Algoriphagus aquatilis]|uniref:Capsule assembly Wzi family protein n=2 Tax=Bacteroidota TaxID=976 RepID=A0ABW0BUP0_9BACT